MSGGFTFEFMKKVCALLLVFSLIACHPQNSSPNQTKEITAATLRPKDVALIVLGTVQDAGSPHIACVKSCCKNLSLKQRQERQVTALGLVDNAVAKKYLFEATPNITTQLKALVRPDVANTNEMVDGIFLTHAHIGHYTGLMYLGKEATDAKNVPVYAMPRLQNYLETSGPWSQLVARKNILLQPLKSEKQVPLTSKVQVHPFLVPHRDEYSETVGYKIIGPNKSALFIPDIDKWDQWEKDIIEEIKKVDYAFLDATFYSGTELNNRDISQIPHPFMIESLALFNDLPATEKAKIIFIHFNHTNPVLNTNSAESQAVLKQGFKIARINEVFPL
jgi:pyrroloquinoline quinone biosynthesis protein B